MRLFRCLLTLIVLWFPAETTAAANTLAGAAGTSMAPNSPIPLGGMDRQKIYLLVPRRWLASLFPDASRLRLLQQSAD